MFLYSNNELRTYLNAKIAGPDQSRVAVKG